MTATEFLEDSFKSITLMGMSGVGKTHLSCILEKHNWVAHSCDYLIGNDYLKEELQNACDSAGDISELSNFIGKLGNPDQGGLDLDEFKRRQRLYYDAECKSLRDVMPKIEQARQDGQNFINDSTGSICEIEEAALIDEVGQNTLFVYLQTSPEDEAEILDRAQKYPKPLFYPSLFLDEKMHMYMREHDLSSPAQIEPNDFARWVFPYLFHARMPKYQKLADRYGITIPAAAMRHVKTEQDFINVIANALSEDETLRDAS